MQNLNNFHWSDTSAQPMFERARVGHRGGAYGYYPPMFGCDGICKCPTEFTDQCGGIPLLVDQDYLVKNCFLDENIDRKALRVATINAQDILQTELGICTMSKLYNYVVNGIEIQDQNGNDINTCVFMDQYVTPVIMYLVQAEVTIPLSLKQKTQGVVRIEGSEFNPALRQDITYLRQYYQYKYEFYLKRLRHKLRCIGIYCTCNILPKANIVL